MIDEREREREKDRIRRKERGKKRGIKKREKERDIEREREIPKLHYRVLFPFLPLLSAVDHVDPDDCLREEAQAHAHLQRRHNVGHLERLTRVFYEKRGLLDGKQIFKGFFGSIITRAEISKFFWHRVLLHFFQIIFLFELHLASTCQR